MLLEELRILSFCTADTQTQAHAQLRRDNLKLKSLLTKYRQTFRRRYPQLLEDLTETDVHNYTPFATKTHLLLWYYKHFIATPTLFDIKMVPRFKTIDWYAGYQERYWVGHREQEDSEYLDIFDDSDSDGIPLRDMRQKLQKLLHRLRKVRSAKQYYAAGDFKHPPLRPVAQRDKFHSSSARDEPTFNPEFRFPFKQRQKCVFTMTPQVLTWNRNVWLLCWSWNKSDRFNVLQIYSWVQMMRRLLDT